MTIRQKLSLVVLGVVLAVTGTLSYFFFTKMSHLQDRFEALYAGALLPMAETQRIRDSLAMTRIAVAQGVGGTGTASDLHEYVAHEHELRAALASYENESSIAVQPMMQHLLDKYGALQDQTARERLALDELKRLDALMTSAVDEIFTSVRAGDRQASHSLFNDTDEVFSLLQASAAVLTQLKLEQGAYAIRESKALLATTRAQFGLTVGASLAFGAIAALMLTAIVLRPLRELRTGTAKVAAGDFSPAIPVRSTDELGQLADAFNTMARDLGSSRRELESHGRTLEATVTERTAELEQARVSLEGTVAERTAQLNTTNANLVSQARELIKRNDEAVLFGKFDDFLQASASEAESYTVVSHLAGQLFHPYSGALYVLNSSRNMLESTAVWGEAPPASVVFRPGACWALRRGQPHVVEGRGLRCEHVAEPGRMSVCAVLAAHGETLGVLHILAPAEESQARDNDLKEKYRLARSLAEHMGLAISNLKLRERMRNLSVRDGLTGLFNRRYMDEVLAQELARARRSGAQVAVLMLDIDHFKGFNDTCGHGAGDMVLRELGRFLGTAVREGDIACRYGGEEFALILAGTNLEAAQQRAEEIRQGVKLLHLEDGGRSLGGITVSLGLAMFPDHGTDPETITKATDSALYQAKGGGRDRLVVFSG